MDDRVFKVKLTWKKAVTPPLAPVKGLPTIGLVMDDCSGHADGWSVLVAPFKSIDCGVSYALLAFIAFDLAPTILKIGSKITLRQGDLVAEGEIAGIICDPHLRSRMVAWSRGLDA